MEQLEPKSTGPTEKKVKKKRFFRGSDLRETVLLSTFGAAIATLPESQWASIANHAARLAKGPRSSRYQRFAQRVRAVLEEDIDDASVMRLWRAHNAAMHRRRMTVLASRYAPQWKPRIELDGRAHVDRSIAAGRGTVLWFDSFVHHPVIGKRAFFDNGYSAWQMSAVDHGFSTSQFGRRFLNPMHLAAEAPYILGRIEFDENSALAATKRVSESLARNEIVRITNNGYIGRQRCFVEFGKMARLPVAKAPLSMGRRNGASILPVSVIEREPFADYLVTVAPPLVIDPDATRGDSIEQAARDYASYLKPLVAAFPDQWRGWEVSRPSLPPPTREHDRKGALRWKITKELRRRACPPACKRGPGQPPFTRVRTRRWMLPPSPSSVRSKSRLCWRCSRDSSESLLVRIVLIFLQFGSPVAVKPTE